MIVVTVELISAVTGKRSVLGRAEIYNDATGDRGKGNYVAKIYRRGQPFRGRVWKAGEVADFPRLRLGPWDLLYRCLKNIVGDRNG